MGSLLHSAFGAAPIYVLFGRCFPVALAPLVHGGAGGHRHSRGLSGASWLLCVLVHWWRSLVCIFMCFMPSWTHTHTHTHARTHTHIHTRTHTHTTHIYTHLCMCVYVRLCACVCACVCVCVCVSVQRTKKRIETRITILHSHMTSTTIPPEQHPATQPTHRHRCNCSHDQHKRKYACI